jgi:isocitrate dehydrogenase
VKSARLRLARQETSTNPIASIFAWTRGLKYRGNFDGMPDVVKFAEALKKVCVATVESGDMTRDLAILIRADHPWLTTNQFLDKLDSNLQKAMGQAQGSVALSGDRDGGHNMR